MKRLIVFILIGSLLCLLSACDNAESAAGEGTVNFYYCTESISYGTDHGVIAFEPRTTGSDTAALESVLSLYFQGPVHKGFLSPFPKGVYAESVTQGDNRIQIALSSAFSELKGLNMTLACVCLSKTVQEFTGVNYVYITYVSNSTGKQQSVTIGPDSYLLTEGTEYPQTPEE